MGSKKYYEELVRKFVDFLNAHDFEPKRPEQIPAELRGPIWENDADWFTWKIQSSNHNPWIEPLEQRLPRRYPAAFRALISGYRFCDFEVGPVMFLANTGQVIFHELAHKAFADKHMSPFLLQHGYLQFAQPSTGDYDPICFAPSGIKDKTESRIVQLDHEEILIRNRIKVAKEIAPSIEEFMQRAIDGTFEVH